MAKIKKSTKQSFFRNNSVTAAAVVVLCMAAGALVVPGIFADTLSTPPSISNVKATANNNSAYSVTVTWDGHTTHHWEGQVMRSGNLYRSWTDTNRSKVIADLPCGINYGFRVAAANANGATTTPYRGDAATPACPTVVFNTFTASGNTVTATWRNGNFAQSYAMYVKAGNGGYSGVSTTSTSRTFTGSCNTTYTAYLTASAGGQTGPGSAAKSVTTAACPAAPPPPSTPQPPSTPSPPPPSGGGSGSTSSGTKRTTTSSGGAAAPTAAPSTAPSTPENFAATVISSKVVKLSWDSSANADHYIVSRSTDGINTEEIANTSSTTYDDETAEFSTTYYYQLQAVGSDGKVSGTVNAQATTDAFKASSDLITSQDKLVTVGIPEGAIDGDYSCTLNTDESAAKAPEGQSTVLGPYDLLCITDEGEVIDDFDKPLTVTMKLASVASGYDDISASTASSKGWTSLSSKYDAAKQQLTFSLSSSKSFVALGVKNSSPLGTIMLTLFILLLIAGGIFGFRYFRRRTPAQAAAVQSQLSAEQEFNQALAQPDCSHLDMAQQVIPSSQGCLECEQQHTQWNSLRICLLCGHVGCSDDSPQQHALKHYQQTGHPLIYDYADPNGNSIGWCYIDQTYI